MTFITRGVEHIGITVPDMEEATSFFQTAFQAEVCYDVLPPDHPPQKGTETEQRLALPAGGEIHHIRMLRIGESINVELFYIEKAGQHTPVDLAGYGMTHLAFYVDDMEKATEAVNVAGGSVLSDPFPLPGPESGVGNVAVYVRTTWGMLMELITYPKGIDYPSSSQATRWQPGE